MSQKFKVLLYYKYTKLADPEKIRLVQRELCEKLNLKGRIIVSSEGINGTVAGLPDDIDTYMSQTEKTKAFSGMDWKISHSSEQIFPKLKIVVRDEIVTLGLKKTGRDVPISRKADYIKPEELKDLYEKNEDFIILDTRNLYESKIGKFKNALVAPIKNFREFPQFAKKLEIYREKEVITYCTGGIRCEKASAYLRQNGFKKVRQLHGGIHEYGNKVGGKYFEGEMFVFDKRLHIPVNTIDPTIISSCIYCKKPVTRYIDCAIKSCHSLFICCPQCEENIYATCSPNCLKKFNSQKKEYNPQVRTPNQFV